MSVEMSVCLASAPRLSGRPGPVAAAVAGLGLGRRTHKSPRGQNGPVPRVRVGAPRDGTRSDTSQDSRISTIVGRSVEPSARHASRSPGLANQLTAARTHRSRRLDCRTPTSACGAALLSGHAALRTIVCSLDAGARPSGARRLRRALSARSFACEERSIQWGDWRPRCSRARASICARRRCTCAPSQAARQTRALASPR